MISRKVLCICVLFAAIAFKFWLIAEMEITDDDSDTPNYVAQILHNGPNFFSPGTGVAGRFFWLVGLPYRDGIEIAYLAACMLVVRALFAWPIESYLALALFLFTYFNPAAEEMASHIMSDPVWLVEVLAGLSLFVLFAAGRSSWRWLLLLPAALCLALSTITRTTIVPLVIAFVIWGLLALFCSRLMGRSIRRAIPIAAGVFAVFACVCAVNYAICRQNFQAYGYYGLSLPDSREYRDFYMCLQSVGDPDGDKYYPVSEARLELIAQAGPASRWFVEAMHTDANFRRLSKESFGQYDYALAFFHFVVFFNTMPNGDPRQGFVRFKTVEDEIATAAHEGRLKTRAILPLPDCRLRIVASALPGAAWTLAGKTVVMPSRYAWDWGGEPKFDNPDYTAALGRRAVVPSPLREKIGAALCNAYAVIYWFMLPALALSLAAWGIGLARTQEPPLTFDPPFLASQLLPIAVAVFFSWNVLFDASGLPPLARHVLLQNVMLPLLTVAYAREAWRLQRNQTHPVSIVS